MFQFLEWLAGATCFGLFIYKWIIIAAVVMTWVSADQVYIVLKKGRVIRTLGLQNNLVSYLSSFDEIKLLLDSQKGSKSYYAYYSYDNPSLNNLKVEAQNALSKLGVSKENFYMFGFSS